MQTVSVEITGTSPLLQHRFGEIAEDGAPTRRVVVDRSNPRVEAEKAAYRAEDGTYYFSAFAIPHAMASAGTNHKMKGSRRTLRFIVPSCVQVTTDTITILDADGPAPSFEVDARPVTIPATKGRIMRYRPRWNTWRAVFDLLVDDS